MQDYLKIVEKNIDDQLKDLSDLIAVPSVVDEKEDCPYPFGTNVQKVLEAALAMGKRDGFKIKNVDNYGAHIEWEGTDPSKGIFALIGHLDVVPPGDGWDTPPFEADIRDDKIFGRGAVDDKGPTMCGYYAMKALKESGFQPAMTIRLILGLDEEQSWKGMDYYMEKEEAPAMGFSPDAEFPVIHCEKGMLMYNVIGKLNNPKGEGIRVLSLTGGNAPNMVADKTTIKFAGDKSALESLKDKVLKFGNENKYEISAEYEEETLVVITRGVSAHGAQPEKGVNAISILMAALAGIKFADEKFQQFVEFYNEKAGFTFHGECFGIGFEDEPSGKLNFNVGEINIKDDDIILTMNVRYPVTFKLEDVVEGIKTTIEPYGYKYDGGDHLGSLYIPKDNELVKVLMDVYGEFTGDRESEPLVIGGATYARAVPNSVAFGPVFPGQDEVEHQPNEYMHIPSMIKATQIFAEAIHRLTK